MKARTRIRFIWYTLIASLSGYVGALCFDLAERFGFITDPMESGLQFLFVTSVAGSICWKARGAHLPVMARGGLIAGTVMLAVDQFLRFTTDGVAWNAIPLIGREAMGTLVLREIVGGTWPCGFVVFYCVIIRQLLRAENALMRDSQFRALGQMAGGIAHDLNNTLTPVVTYSELLQTQGDLDERQKTWVDAIAQAGRDATQVVKNLQLMYRQGNAFPDSQTIPVAQLIEQIALLTRPKWKDYPEQHGHHIELHTDVETGLLPLRGSITELRQVLINLIFNATEAMPEGGQLTLRAHSRTNRLILDVIDSGTGMTPEQLQSCFEPFYSTKPDGSGLGLSACRSVVQRHGGKITLNSRPQVGTTVSIELPVSADAPAHLSAAQSGSGPSRFRRLLYIDDDAAVRDSMVALCQTLGIEVEAVEGGATALQTLESTAIDAVITDLGMSGMDGAELTRQIKRSRPELPVIVISGWSKERVLQRFEDSLKPDGVMEKPPTTDGLQTALTDVAG